MRLNEIEDESNIAEIFKEHFDTGINGKSDPTVWSVRNGLVYVKGYCRLTTTHLRQLPVNFGDVSSNFSIHGGNLTTLKGCPPTVGGNFNCSNNEIVSLEGGPTVVDGRYICFSNRLKDFVGAPEKINSNFTAGYNPLRTKDGTGHSLDGLPKDINGQLVMPYESDLPLLRILFIHNLSRVTFDPVDDDTIIVESILNRYIGRLEKRKGAIQCAAELSKAGFKKNARL